MGDTITIMNTLPVFLLLASASAAPQLEGLANIFKALAGDDEAGETNGDYEQVPYTTLKTYNGYEMRQYPSVKWACTEVTYRMEQEAGDAGDADQFNIIKAMTEMMSGSNWKNKPENKMFMKLFRYISGVNKEHQANPPTPVDAAVRIESNKEFTVYVHQFGGYAMKDAVNVREANKFAEVLRSAGEEVDTSTFYTAGYDSPMKFWNRRNEIMFLVPGNDL